MSSPLVRILGIVSSTLQFRFTEADTYYHFENCALDILVPDDKLLYRNNNNYTIIYSLPEFQEEESVICDSEFARMCAKAAS